MTYSSFKRHTGTSRPFWVKDKYPPRGDFDSGERLTCPWARSLTIGHANPGIMDKVVRECLHLLIVSSASPPSQCAQSKHLRPKHIVAQPIGLARRQRM